MARKKKSAQEVVKAWNKRREKEKKEPRMFKRAYSSIMHLWDGSYSFEKDVFDDQKQKFFEEYNGVYDLPYEEQEDRLSNMVFLCRACHHQITKDGACFADASAVIRMKDAIHSLSKYVLTGYLRELLEGKVERRELEDALEKLFNRIEQYH